MKLSSVQRAALEKINRNAPPVMLASKTAAALVRHGIARYTDTGRRHVRVAPEGREVITGKRYGLLHHERTAVR